MSAFQEFPPIGGHMFPEEFSQLTHQFEKLFCRHALEAMEILLDFEVRGASAWFIRHFLT